MPQPLYATRTDLENVKVISASLQQLEPEIKDAALENASGYVDTYLSQRYTLPLVLVDAAIRRHTLSIVIWDLMSQQIGINPDASSEKVFRQNYTDAIEWLKAVVASTVSPAVTDSAGHSTGGAATPGAPADSGDRATARGASSRGFSVRGTGRGRGLFQGD